VRRPPNQVILMLHRLSDANRIAVSSIQTRHVVRETTLNRLCAAQILILHLRERVLMHIVTHTLTKPEISYLIVT